jgi:hypothetical protein
MLVEALFACVILTGGMVAVAQLMTVSLRQHQLGRSSTDAVQLVTAKIEELTKLNFGTAPAIQVTPVNPDSLTTNVANYFDVPVANTYTRRWRVTAGPAANTRILTVRLIPTTANRLVAKEFEITTILRRW